VNLEIALERLADGYIGIHTLEHMCKMIAESRIVLEWFNKGLILRSQSHEGYILSKGNDSISAENSLSRCRKIRP
jgi:hypothetical protein